jgi:TrpR-related protein YerC/YecD
MIKNTDKNELKFKAAFSDSEMEELTDLYNAILTLKNPEEVHKFFKDLCSVNELQSFLHRWQIVRRIEQGKSYEEIIKELSGSPEGEKTSEVTSEKRGSGRVRGKSRSSTKVSSTTISRVKTCYINPDGGYRTALKRLNERDNKEQEEKSE